MTKGKSKGSAFERATAKYLTEWLTGQSNQYYFWRSPGSGSISTVTGCNPDLHGDIVPLKEEAKFLLDNCVIECKSGYKTASIDKHLKYSIDDKILSFWEQVNNDTEGTKFPILIFKKKGMKPWVGINKQLFDKCIDNINNLRYIFMHWDNSIDDIYLFDMAEFFDNITPDIMKEILYV